MQLKETPFIKRIALSVYRIALKEPFKISLGTLSYAENVLVTIQSSGGNTGYGECSPFMTIHHESAGSSFDAGIHIGGKLKGLPLTDIPQFTELMDQEISGHVSIKSAFDIALYDLASQMEDLPLYKFLGGSSLRPLVTDYTVSLDSSEKMAADAMKIKEQGFPVIKVKLGGSYEEDMQRMQSIRSAIGNDIPLRIDANQGWDKVTAMNILRSLEGWNIQHCEEPILKRQWNDLSEIRAASAVPVMADESCFDEKDAELLILHKSCDRINIKLGKSSGFTKALRVLRLAEKAGMKIQIGGFLESRLGFTAAAHLAMCSDAIEFIDFDTALMFQSDPVQGGIRYGKNGRIDLPPAPGLGAVIKGISPVRHLEL